MTVSVSPIFIMFAHAPVVTEQMTVYVVPEAPVLGVAMQQSGENEMDKSVQAGEMSAVVTGGLLNRASDGDMITGLPNGSFHRLSIRS